MAFSVDFFKKCSWFKAFRNMAICLWFRGIKSQFNNDYYSYAISRFLQPAKGDGEYICVCVCEWMKDWLFLVPDMWPHLPDSCEDAVRLSAFWCSRYVELRGITSHCHLHDGWLSLLLCVYCLPFQMPLICMPHGLLLNGKMNLLKLHRSSCCSSVPGVLCNNLRVSNLNGILCSKHTQ